jgi:hypothetical protein
MSAPELADITTCVHCGQKFSHPRLTIIGENKARLNSYMKGLNDHLAQKHPDLGLQMAQHGMAFMEMIFLRNFRTTDPELSEQQDRVRWQIHQQTLKARYPDDNLEQQCEDLAVEITKLFIPIDKVPDTLGSINFAEKASEVAGVLVKAFTSIRDALEEPGKYPVPVPESSKVLV